MWNPIETARHDVPVLGAWREGGKGWQFCEVAWRADGGKGEWRPVSEASPAKGKSKAKAVHPTLWADLPLASQA